MQGRSIGSKRNVGDAAPQPTRASIYRDENTPHEWAAAHDLRAQLALPQRPAELHPRALRHGLIASQLGLPMLARAEGKQPLEEWEGQSDSPAAYSGEAQHAGLDWSNNEQTTRYDEWELQKELVTYEETYPGYDPSYDEHPQLDFLLPPIAAGHEQRHELDYAQAAYAPAEYAEHDHEHISSPGSYPYTQMAPQPAAARWHAEQPIRRVPDYAHTEARTVTQASFGPASQARTLDATPRTREQRQAAFATRTTPAAHATQTRITPHPHASQTHAELAARAHASQAHAHASRAHATPLANPGVATHAGFATRAHASQAHAHASRAHAAPHANAGSATHAHAWHVAPHGGQLSIPHISARAAIGTAKKVREAAASSPLVWRSSAPWRFNPPPKRPPRDCDESKDGVGHVEARAPHAHSAQVQGRAGFSGQRAAGGAGVRARAMPRYADDEPVVYPHGGSWLKRFVVLLALAGAGYAAHHYYFNYYQSAPAPAPAPPPPPTAAPVIAPEPPAPAAAQTVEPTPLPAETTQSTKESRSAARAALIAERWRERHAARRARDDDSARDDTTARRRARVRTDDSGSSSYATTDSERDAEPGRSYARAESDRTRASTSAHDHYMNDRHAAAQSGTLRINSLPWSQVHIDGQLVGHTPQMNLLLPSGKHRVTLVNSEMQLEKSLTVQITAGTVTTHTINLAE